MLEKPEIQDQLILSRLQNAYGLHVSSVTFLPLGADVNTAVYRAVTKDETAYFLKLRKGGFDEITVTIPRFLKDRGMTSIIAPLETRKRQLWESLGDYKMILYPFIEGKNGYEVALSDRQWVDFGRALKGIHSARVPPALKRRIPIETYSSHGREIVRRFQSQIEETHYEDSVAERLAAFMKARRIEIDHMVKRAGELALALQTRSLRTVLCHTDIHAGNLLIGEDGAGAHRAGTNSGLYIVDWDNPILAPKERDLLLIGGCPAWNSPREVALFYQGYNPRYGMTEVDPMALAYYRYERIIQDIAVFCEQLLLTTEGGEDRERAYQYFEGQFLPDHEVEIASKTDQLLMN